MHIRPSTVWGSTILIPIYSFPNPLGWGGTQIGWGSSALDTILIDGGIEIQNGWVAYLVGGRFFMYQGGWRRWQVQIF